MNLGERPTAIRASTRPDDGSIRDTTFSALLAAQTLPKPATTTSVRAPVLTRLVIVPVRRSSRLTVVEFESLALSGIQSALSMYATAPSRPVLIGAGIRRTTESFAGSISLTTPSPHVGTHTLSLIHISEPTRLLSISYAV